MTTPSTHRGGKKQWLRQMGSKRRRKIRERDRQAVIDAAREVEHEFRLWSEDANDGEFAIWSSDRLMGAVFQKLAPALRELDRA